MRSRRLALALLLAPAAACGGAPAPSPPTVVIASTAAAPAPSASASAAPEDQATRAARIAKDLEQLDVAMVGALNAREAGQADGVPVAVLSSGAGPSSGGISGCARAGAAASALRIRR